MRRFLTGLFAGLLITAVAAVANVSYPPSIPGQVLGTPTNDAAAVGNVGQIISATRAFGSPLALTTITPATITSVTLTPGNWDCSTTLYFAPVSTTVVTNLTASQSATTNTLDFTEGKFIQAAMNYTTSGAPQFGYVVGPVNYSVAFGATLNVFAVGQAVFSVSTLSGVGTIRCGRVR